ncbi:MAG TPA: hypothetical protein PLU63_01840 [Candidatus Woesebacteria bacterium]|nr:hypothetical protein [Candidatus Woesebacteria bacterium]
MINSNENKGNGNIPNLDVTGKIIPRQEPEPIIDLDPTNIVLAREVVENVSLLTGIPGDDYINALKLIFPNIRIEESSIKPSDGVSEDSKVEKTLIVHGVAMLDQVKKALDSDQEKAAELVWDLLSLEEVNKAATAEEAREAFGNTNFGKVRYIAIKKWHELSEKEAKDATTARDAMWAMYNAPKDSKPRELALRRWYELSSIEIQTANTYDKGMSAYSNAPPELDLVAFMKLISLCDTSHQVMEAYSSVAQMGTIFEGIALQRISELDKKKKSKRS